MTNSIKTIILNIKNKPLDAILYLIFAVVIIKLYFLYFSVNPDDSHWKTFKSEHNCQLLRTEHGTKKLSWKCDDGKVYYRWMQQR